MIVTCFCFLLVVFSAGGYFPGAVDLFHQHYAEQLMRKSHGGYRQPEVCFLLDAVVQPKRRSDDETDLAPYNNPDISHQASLDRMMNTDITVRTI